MHGPQRARRDGDSVTGQPQEAQTAGRCSAGQEYYPAGDLPMPKLFEDLVNLG
jgi:hypothetical protein